jgi:hypothetical protein
VSAESRIEGKRQAQDEKSTTNSVSQVTAKVKPHLRRPSRFDLVFRVSVRRYVLKIGLFNCSNESTHFQLAVLDESVLIGAYSAPCGNIAAELANV